MDRHDAWLSAQLVELAESVVADHSDAPVAKRLTLSLAELLAPAEVALMVPDPAGGMAVAAASTSRARELALHESQLREGPSIECAAMARAVLNEPVGQAAARWPAFAAAASAAGFGMVSALPLLCQAQAMGVIGVLAAGEWRLCGADLGPAEILARAAAVAFSQQRELRESARAAAQLQHALDSRVLIEQAKGATAARLGITPEAAFSLLRAYARRESRALSDIARETVSGDMPASQLFGPRQGSSRRLTRQSG